MQQGDAMSSYYQYYHSLLQHSEPNPTSNSNDLQASAPPFSAGYSCSDYQSHSSAYPPYSSYSRSSDDATAPPNINFLPPELSSRSSFSDHVQPYDQHRTPQGSDPHYPAHNSDMNSIFPGNSHSTSAGPANTLMPASHEDGMKFDGRGGYFNESWSHGVFRSDGYGGGVYAYDGSKMESYGGSGSRPDSFFKTAFDDYGRPICLPKAYVGVGSEPTNKIVKTTPKMDVQYNTESGVQKFRVKLLAEGGGPSDMDVLCQVWQKNSCFSISWF